jgi:site-specific DNA recombinase
LAVSSTSTRTKLEGKRDRIESERQRNIDLVVKQVIGEDDARGRIAELKAQRLQVEVELAALEEAPSIITLHPAALDQYIETVDVLAAALADHARAEDDRGSLVASFRALVHSVTIHPNGPREGFEIEVKGRLAALIGGDAFPQAMRSGGYMVAGARYGQSPRQQIPAFPFRC